MQLVKQDIRIVEKLVQTEKGLFLARFAVVNVAGTLKAKLIDMTPVNKQPQAVGQEVLCIAAPKVGQTFNFSEPKSKEIVSPYFLLEFFTSQPTRAPNL